MLAQQDNSGIIVTSGMNNSTGETQSLNLNIYPVPVRDDSFTIKSDREFVSVKITNVIGQDIYRIKYNTAQSISKVVLDNPQRGMYIVTIGFTDGTRIVRKIMIEGYY